MHTGYPAMVPNKLKGQWLCVLESQWSCWNHYTTILM